MKRLNKKANQIIKLSDDPKYKDLQSAWIDNSTYRDGNFVVFDEIAYLGNGEHYNTFKKMRDKFKENNLIPKEFDDTNEYPEKYKNWDTNCITGSYLNNFLGKTSYFLSKYQSYDLNELIIAFNKISSDFSIYKIIGMDELEKLY